ncbi:MAG: HAD family hydrolase [Chlorobi bacterium]|nr:HAD family hydrolase [Chlorobiota bacterium]
MNLKVITIDFWNTLFDSGNAEKRNNLRITTFLNETDKLGFYIKYGEIEKTIKASWEYFNKLWIEEQRTPTALDLVKFFWDYLNLPENKKAMIEIADEFANSILDYPPNLLEYVEESLKELKKKYRLAIISDTGFSPGSILKKLLEKEKILKYFDEFSFSDETGVAKPNKKAYLTALDKLDCKPESALHIGDIERTDIVGAKQLGMRAIRFIGDSTTLFIKNNSKTTIADAKVSSWKNIINTINNIENNS